MTFEGGYENIFQKYLDLGIKGSIMASISAYLVLPV